MNWHHNPELSRGVHQLVYDEKGVLVADIGHALRSPEETMQHVRLIQAAPDMFAVLELFERLRLAGRLEMTVLGASDLLERIQSALEKGGFNALAE